VRTGERQVASLAAAVSQLELALRESRGPVLVLGDALGRLGDGLSSHASAAELQREVSNCLEALQFYDRMTQHLSHVRDFISSMTSLMDQALSGAEDEAVWDALRERLRERLISDAQRELLDLLAPPATGPIVAPGALPPPHADPGSIELF